MGLLFMDTRDHFSVTEFKYSKKNAGALNLG